VTGRRAGALFAELSRAQPAAGVRVMVWTTSATMVVCGLYTAAAALLRSGAAPPAGPFWVALAAVAGGAVVAAFRRHYQTWHYHLLQPGTAAAVAAGVHLDGGGAASLADASLFLVLTALASFFFPWTTAAVHVLISCLLLVGVLSTAPGIGAGDVVALTCSTLVVGVLVGALSRFSAHAVLAAELDVLTGLPNRRGAERHLTAALAGHRSGQPLSLAVVDLDHFKQVNDTLGHAAGDELLRRTAGAWTALLPASAVLGRWGGDEFVLLAPLAPARTQALVDALRAALPAGRSCTAGVTGLASGDDLDAALGRADQALYRAKREGRGRTGVWSPADGGGQPWLDSQPSMRSDSGSSGSSASSRPEAPSSGASSRSMPTAAI
jgi:diguanylate cyclase (GGDEF)-like protein